MSPQNRRPVTWATAVVVLAAALMMASSAEASKTARTVSLSAGAASLWHAGISFVAPNPVTPVTSFIYGCVGLGAGIYDAVVDPPPEEPPQILRVVTGPATDRDMTSGELVAAGDTISGAPVLRVVSLMGTGFSWQPEDMEVTFDGVPAKLGPLSTNTLVSVVVPPLDGHLPRAVELKISVQGAESPGVAFEVEPPVSVVDPGLALRILDRLRQLTEKVRDYDWGAQLQAESPDLSETDRAEAMTGADDMVSCAEEALAQIPAYESLLSSDGLFTRANNQLLTASPEIGELIEASIAALDAGAADLRRIRPETR